MPVLALAQAQALVMALALVLAQALTLAQAQALEVASGDKPWRHIFLTGVLWTGLRRVHKRAQPWMANYLAQG